MPVYAYVRVIPINLLTREVVITKAAFKFSLCPSLKEKMVEVAFGSRRYIKYVCK